jgi:hypothetical protein
MITPCRRPAVGLDHDRVVGLAGEQASADSGDVLLKPPVGAPLPMTSWRRPGALHERRVSGPRRAAHVPEHVADADDEGAWPDHVRSGRLEANSSSASTSSALIGTQSARWRCRRARAQKTGGASSDERMTRRSAAAADHEHPHAFLRPYAPRARPVRPHSRG